MTDADALGRFRAMLAQPFDEERERKLWSEMPFVVLDDRQMTQLRHEANEARRTYNRYAASEHGQPGEDEGSWSNRLDQLRAHLVDSAGLDSIADAEPLIPGVLDRDGIAWIYGPPGCGKSFIALDMAGCVGTGEHWQGFGPVKAGPVLYVVAEGARGVKKRVRAWEQAMGTPMAQVHFLPVAVQSGVPADWRALVELTRELQPVLVVLDTQARITVGLEENSAKDMGVFVDKVERLRGASGACVLIVHHNTRNSDHLRGSTGMEGAAQSVIRVTKAEEILTVTSGKQKDAADFDDLKLRMVPMGESVILAMTDGREGAQSFAATAKWLRAWWEAHRSDPVSVSVLIKSEVVSERTFHRYKHGLMDRGVITRVGHGLGTRYVLQAEPHAA